METTVANFAYPADAITLQAAAHISKTGGPLPELPEARSAKTSGTLEGRCHLPRTSKLASSDLQQLPEAYEALKQG